MAGETGWKLGLVADDDHDIQAVWIAPRVTWSDEARFSETATVTLSASAASPVRASAKASVSHTV